MHGSRLGGSNRRAGAEARIEGQSRECRGLESFIAPAPSVITKRCSRSAAVDPDIAPFL